MATVRYLVNEVETSIRFYVDLLGFEVAEDYAPAMAIGRREDLTLWLAGPLAPPVGICRRTRGCRGA